MLEAYRGELLPTSFVRPIQTRQCRRGDPCGHKVGMGGQFQTGAAGLRRFAILFKRGACHDRQDKGSRLLRD